MVNTAIENIMKTCIHVAGHWNVKTTGHTEYAKLMAYTGRKPYSNNDDAILNHVSFTLAHG